jgi:hypothetical protein
MPDDIDINVGTPGSANGRIPTPPSTQAALDVQRQQLAEMLRANKEQNGENRKLIDTLVKTVEGVNQQIDALKLQHAQGGQSTGEWGESDYYRRTVHPNDVKAKGAFDPSALREGERPQPATYLKTDQGALRLQGHQSTRKSAGHVWGLLDDPNPRDDAQRRLQKAVQDRGLVRRMLAAAQGVQVSEVYTPQSDWAVERAMADMPEGIRRIFSASAAIGLEWIPTRTSPELEREVLAQVGFSSIFPVYDHPGGVLQLPYESGFLQAFTHTVPTGDLDPPTGNDARTSIGTGNTTVTPTALAVAAQVDRDAAEDAIIAILPQLYFDMGWAFAFADDNTVINGNVSGAQDLLASWNPRGKFTTIANNTNNQLRRWEGLRKLGLAGGASSSINLNAAQTTAGLMSMVNLLGIEQLMDSSGGSRVVIGLEPGWFFQKGLFLAEFDAWTDVGALASVLTGALGDSSFQSGPMLPNQVGFIYARFPVCLIYALTRDQNASGVFDNVTTTRNSALAIDRLRYEQWRRQGFFVESDVEIRNNTITVIGRQRNVFRPKRLSSTQFAAAVGYNMT